ncbi:alpha/beta fold hydrolase [Simiduia aestuariiviva]|uniref:Pimeloyl-ACP methyl ester carboxylesterase n=1 Tax=Simiduia aestuariiviva TaxID=1510459 RepID=A0A839USX9_9GAMM|nr:alpha/beta fold hydrolase [Simiduia aestuariiviva]MBB3168608.1 pimeloyl-ACP methyl ester carboxylesterase [Simiduia aestuariiviva]
MINSVRATVCVVLLLGVVGAGVVWWQRAPSAPSLPENVTELIPAECWFTPEMPADCYRLRVVDAGQTFELPVVILRADQPSQAAVLYLSGGPGGSAFLSSDDMIYWQAQYRRLALNADLVLVDRRGTGLALPNLQCEVYRRDYRSALAKNYSAHRENDIIFQSMSACFDQHLSPAPEAHRIAVSALGTQADRRDMLALMSALPYAQWHVWGVSYGTRLALAIAEQAPPTLATLVLDSVYPPGRGSNEEWPLLMSESMNRFFRWCDAKSCADYRAQTWTSEQLFQSVLTRLDRHPMTLSLPSWYGDAPYTLVVNGQRFLQIAFSAIYDQYLWPDIAATLIEVPNGRDDALKSLAENFINNAFDPVFSELVFYAAECKDNLPSERPAVTAALAQSTHYRRYLEGQMQWDVCAADAFEGRRGAEQLPTQLAAQIQVPVLMLSGAIDPITPAEWIEPLQATLPQWQSAVFADVGHAVVASDACAEQLLASFVHSPLQKLRVQGEGCRSDQIQLQYGGGVH